MKAVAHLYAATLFALGVIVLLVVTYAGYTAVVATFVVGLFVFLVVNFIRGML